MDLTSHVLCNRLLQNRADAATLEIHFGGLGLEITVHSWLCLTGAELPLSLNGAPMGGWQVFAAAPGDRISVAPGGRGCRAYLGIAGGFLTPLQFGSRASVPREGLGHAVRAGDELPCDGNAGRRRLLMLPRRWQPPITRSVTLRIVPGYQYGGFGRSARRCLYAQPWTMSAQSDRMGCRLDGAALQSPGGSFLSEGIAAGAVQVPQDGRPIVLLQDRQTIGGYPKLGAVVAPDLDRLAQVVPGGEVVFTPVSPALGRRIALGAHRFRTLAPLAPLR